MKRLLLALFAVALTAGTTWAGPVSYTYDWTPSANFVTADSGPAQVNFTNQSVLSGVGSTGMVASNPVLATADPGTWTNKDVAFKVTINDNGDIHSETFNGLLNGSFTGSASSLAITITDSLVRDFTLNGGDAFELTMSGITPIPVKSSNTIAAIGASLTVDGGNGEPPPPPPTNDVPEPSTVLLSVLGLGGLGLRAWRRRKLVNA